MRLRLLSGKEKMNSYEDVISDLDDLISQPIRFKLFDKAWSIKPMSTETCFIAWQQFSRLDHLTKQKEVSMSDALKLYGELFESVIEDFDAELVKNMTQAQCGALLKLVFDSVSGQAQADAKKKAQLEKMETQEVPNPVQSFTSTRRSWWVRSVVSTGGRLTKFGKCLLVVCSLCTALCVSWMLLKK